MLHDRGRRQDARLLALVDQLREFLPSSALTREDLVEDESSA
jgi:hypothetical protein